jgi:hypothetical protein
MMAMVNMTTAMSAAMAAKMKAAATMSAAVKAAAVEAAAAVGVRCRWQSDRAGKRADDCEGAQALAEG